MPRLCAEKSEGIYEDIPEDELYKYSGNRWVSASYNESKRLSERYLKFDLQQLLDVVVEALSSEGARHCTRVLKCKEGLNNKAFILTMDNGLEIFAKLLNPIAGPAYYTTASEVATREFLRDVLDIPTPRIIAWSAYSHNPVGAEYILEEKAPGRPLGSLWYQWPMESKMSMITQIVQIEQKLASVKFSQSGCLYFKGDVPGTLSGNALLTNVSTRPSLLGRYSLGLFVSNGLWRGHRARMNLDRGPYSTPIKFVEAMARNEMEFIKLYAKPRMNYHRSSTEPESPAEALDLLQRYLKLTPAMVPPVGKEDTHSPTLWHPDLHLDNSEEITRIIDWQSAAIMPFYYQCGIPRMFRHPGKSIGHWIVPELPADYESLDPAGKAKANAQRDSEVCQSYYEVQTADNNPRHWAAIQLWDAEIRTEPSRLAINVWEDKDIFFLRRALLSIVEQWSQLCPDSGPCPVSFSEQELKLHYAEEESMSDMGEILKLFKNNWGLPPDGMVDPAHFNRIKALLPDLREAFIAGGDDEEQKKLFDKLWPFQDTDDSYDHYDKYV
ncbi:hypothetical protein F5884DRAFT_747609 [Xylogone sp. PMI_703]|nr:hypothetical protein F5884DRAFT_747609 [Xylogone sp. PMI_703]